MLPRPRPRSESILTSGVKLTAGLVGLYMAIVLDPLIWFGKDHCGTTAAGSSIGLTALALMLVVPAYERRSLSGTAFTMCAGRGKPGGRQVGRSSTASNACATHVLDHASG